MKTAIGPFGAIREIVIVSGSPGVTKPSETTFAFMKMNLVRCLPLEERSTAGLAVPVAGSIRTPPKAASAAATARVRLPADTRVTIAGRGRVGKHDLASIPRMSIPQIATVFSAQVCKLRIRPVAYRGE